MTDTMVTLQGKKALVIGAASGIGEETARLFSELGAELVVADRNIEAQRAKAESLGASAAFAVNVADEAQVVALLDAVPAELGGLDCVVNCAGIGGDFTPTVEQDLKAWQRTVDVNLRGSYLVSREAGRRMLDAGRGGCIVNFSSLTGVGGFPRRNAYGASKAGVAMMTKSLACEWGAAGVRVNCIVPGYILTPTPAAWVQDNKLDDTRIVERTPLRRWGQPLDVARVVAFLCCDWASFLTGVVLPVDGGWTAFGGAGEVATA